MTWSLPSGAVQPGDRVSASISATCEGAGKWKILDAQGDKVAAGTTPCNVCSSTALFSYTAGSSPLAGGSYTVEASFDQGHGVDSSPTSSFTVAGGQSSAAIVSSSASVVALALLVGHRKLNGDHARRRKD